MVTQEEQKYLEMLLGNLEKTALKRLEMLPNPHEIPFMEPHLRALYFETYNLTAFGFNNASLVMQGVLLEAFVKEVIYYKEGKDFKGEFGPAIQRCDEKEYLGPKEIDFLRRFKNNIRNRYQHTDIEEISAGIKFPAWKVRPEDVLDKDKITAIKKKIREGTLKPEFLGRDELRPLGFLAKSKVDEMAIPQFMETDKFVRAMAEKHFKPHK